MTNLSNSSGFIAARTDKAEQIEQLRLRHPELRQIEAALLRELAQVTSSFALDKSEATAQHNANHSVERLNSLRMQRQSILQELGLDDDYAQPLYKCSRCHDLMLVQDNGNWIPCTCWQEHQLSSRRQRAGITQRMQEQTFASFSLEYYAAERRGEANESALQRAEKALQGCQRFVDEVTGGQAEYGLYVFGDPGVGKTHLAAAIANALVEREIEVRYQVSAGLLSALRATYDESAGENRLHESGIIDDLSRVPVLILDDIGVDRFTPWAVEKFYQIINYRYLKKLPTVFTSNLPLDNLSTEMGEGGTALRIVSRIAESCRVYLLIGVDIRFWKR